MLSHIVSDLHEHYVKEILEPQIGKDKTKAKPDSPSDLDGDGNVDSFEKKVRQFIYDVRHLMRKNNIPVEKAYQMRSSNTQYGSKVISAAKEKLGIKAGGTAPVSEERTPSDKLFSVLIRYKNGTSYRKRTSRKEIQRLRSNPNVSSVEMTRYGVDGVAKKDYDGDGKVESGSKEHAGAVHNAIQREKGGVPDGKDTRGKKKKSYGVDEAFSNWREELIEVSSLETEKTDKVSEKKNIKNTVIVNPELKIESAVENLGGKLIDIVEEDLNEEETEVVDIFEDITNAEFYFFTNDLIEEVVTEFFIESLDEGYDVDFITNALLECLDESLEVLNENQYIDAMQNAQNKKRRAERRSEKIQKVKDTVKKVGSAIKSGLKKAGKAVAHGAGYVAGKAVSAAKKVGSEVKSGYEKGSSSGSQSTTSRTRSASTGSSRTRSASTGSSDNEKPGLRSYLKSSLKKGLKKAVGKAARSISRGARNVARAVGEQTEINEKITAKTDMGAAIKDFYSSKSPQLAGRTKEERRKAAIAAVLTARRGGKKLGEAIVDQQTPADDSVRKTQRSAVDKQQLQNMKMIQQKKMMLDRQKLQMQKAGKLPLHDSNEFESELVDEATAAAKRGLPDTHRPHKEARASKAAASLAAVKKGDERKEKLSKKYNRPPASGDTVEKTAHKKNFPGSRQKPKPTPVSATKDTPEAQNVAKKEHEARVTARNARFRKYGPTKKQAATTAAIRSYGRLD